MKYIANPVEVDAYRIVSIIPRPDGAAEGLILKLENGDAVQPKPEMMSRITPAVGDYWVIQSDGYMYLNPKDVFERKYSPKAE